MNDTFDLPDQFTSYEQAMQTINYGLPGMPADIYAGEYGLARVFQLLESIGSPQNTLKVIHIAGTSGKGTTAYMLDAALRMHGLRVGLSVSPYVYDMKERWYVNGEFLADEVILEAANQVLQALHIAQAEKRLTSRFETMICLMFLLMKRQKVDYAVVETGMGGRLDPTNTVQRADKISALTSIGLDHTHILGSELSGIAAEKAGIIQEHSTVFTYKQNVEVDDVFKKIAGEKEATIHVVEPIDESTEEITPPMFNYNAALVYAVVKEVVERESLEAISQSTIITRLRTLSIPGRNERLLREDRSIILDGAHNLQKLEALAQSVEQEFEPARLGVVVIISREQQVDGILKLLCSLASEVIIVDYPSDFADIKQAVPLSDLQGRAQVLGLKVTVLSNELAIDYILRSSKNWLVTGSFYHLSYYKDRILA